MIEMEKPVHYYVDRRRIRALMLANDRRRQQRRRANQAVTNERRKESTASAEGDLRRGRKRAGFFCSVSLAPGNLVESCERAIEGLILNISSRGMAVTTEEIPEWLTSGCSINVTWGASTESSGKVLWDKFSPNYLNMGRNHLLGIALHEKRFSTETTSVESLRSTGTSQILKAISELTEVDLYPLYIDGKDVDTGIYGFAVDAQKLIVNPAEVHQTITALSRGLIPERYGESIHAVYSIATDVHIKEAIESAFEAGQELKHVTLAKRRRLFRDLYENIMGHRTQLVDLMIKEGHPLQLAEWEYAGMVKAYEPKTVKFCLDQLFKKVGVDGNEHLYLTRKPDGVVGVLPPGNAPCPNSLLAAFALLAGNALIIKPPIRNPVSTMYLWRRVIGEVLKANRIHPGAVNVIVGDSQRILDGWCGSSKINDIVYFGDSESGLRIGSQVYAKGKKPILELSGNDAMIVWNDADLESAANSVLDGFLGSMQICMVARRVLVHPEVYEDFEALVLNKVRRIGFGLPGEQQSRLAPVGQIEVFYEFLLDALGKGAKLLYGGTRVDYKGDPSPAGVFLAPTILRVEDMSKAETMICTIQEGFFPLVTLIKAPVASCDEDIFSSITGFLKKNMYGLRISFWAESSRYIKMFIKHTHNSGLLRINVSHTGFSALIGTHGGPGRSGGPFGELNYLWEKTSHLQGVCVRKKH